VELTPGAKVVVVDDASREPVAEATYRFEQPAGIARAKNKCLELLQDCDHIFLFDDDCYPLREGWWRPYVESPEPHLMRIFEDLAGPKKINDNTCTYRDSQHVAWAHPRGCMLYVRRDVLDVVGGMDPEFGTWGWEHVDWSNRIHAAGLTTWRFADVVGSDELVRSLDEHEQVERSVPRAVRDRLVGVNGERAAAQRNLPKFCEWREQHDAVITCLLTGQPDPQRGRRMRADPGLLSGLLGSLGSHRAVVLHDGLEVDDTATVTWKLVEAPMSPYFARWLLAWQHLRDHPEVRFVWCVDGTDVEMLHDPFPHMKPGRLYVGSEPSTLANDWLRSNHPSPDVQAFIADNNHLQLLNAGLVGGDRRTVMGFLHDIVRAFFDGEIDRFTGAVAAEREMSDMGVFNLVAWSRWADRLVYGPQVNTVFKANERNDWSWWRHK